VLGLYLHIPFCSAICAYCNFNRGLFDEALKTRYVGAIRREIARTGGALGRQAADTIYFGGGTPSLLDSAEIGALVDECRRAFRVAPGAEVTLEANPESVTLDRLRGWLAAGVNRLSFGVQSFRDDELGRLGRLHDARRAETAVALARAAGCENVSLDLMMWLPGQTVDDWLESVDRASALAPDHLSMYMLELYPNAPLREEMARGGWSLAPDDDAVEMYVQALERLGACGLRQYEISNLSVPGRESRHNLKYWTLGSWAGFGCGAHSTVGRRRWKNVAGTEAYVEAMARDEPVAVDEHVLDDDGQLREALFMGLRLAGGIDMDEVSRRFDDDVWARFGSDLAPALEAGLLVRTGARLRLTTRGMLLANEVMSVFV
jgi:oxygen-independent coproporphyrinogen-3 oxidase